MSKKIRKGSVVIFFQVLFLLNLNDNKELVFFGLPGELVKLLSWQLRKEHKQSLHLKKNCEIFTFKQVLYELVTQKI